MSPRVLKVGKFEFKIYTNDHTPAHVHVFSAEKRAKIILDPIDVEWSQGFTSRELKRVRQIIADNQDMLLIVWHHIHPTK